MSMVRKQARLSSDELHELKQLMGAMLALLSIWSLTSLEFGSQLILLVGGLVAIFALCFPRYVARIPPSTWRWAGPIILIYVAADFVLHMPEFLAPLMRMVIWLIIYRMLAPRTQREDLQVILLCLFCVVISGVLTVSLVFAFQILLFAPLAMAMLFVICLLDRGKGGPVHQVDWERFRWPRLIRRVWRVVDFRIVSLCSVMFAVVVAISTFIFVLMPRFDLDQAIPFLEISASARSGFSEEVKLGEVSEIQNDNSVALRVDVPSLESLDTTPYWRMLVLDRYRKGHFSLSESLRTRPFRQLRKDSVIRSSTIPRSERTGDLWTIYMEGGISRYFPMPGEFVALRFQALQDIDYVREVHVYSLDSVGQNVFSYQIQDLKFNQRFEVGEIEADVLKTLPLEVTSDDSLAYPFTTLELNLTEASRQSLRAINDAIGSLEGQTVAEYSQKVTEYLWQRFAYSLRPDGAVTDSEDPVIGWLEGGTRGHCELFASAFILIARDAGYAARMVVGFTGGNWNSVEDYFVVRNRDAHAWVEIYDADQGNWLRVDPTPGNTASDPEVVVPPQVEVESGMAAWVDSLRIQWYRRIVNFEQEDQVKLANTLKEVFTEYMASFRAKLKSLNERLSAWIANPFDLGYLWALLLISCVVVATYIIWRVRYVLLNVLYQVLRKPKALDPLRRQAGRYLKRLKAKGIETGVINELQAIRFGPETKASLAGPVFERARKALKRRRQS